jgi:hypothetical protein
MSGVELLVVQAINGMGAEDRFALVERVVRECSGATLDHKIGAAVGLGISSDDLQDMMVFLAGARQGDLKAALDAAGVAHNMGHPIVTGAVFASGGSRKPKRRCWVKIIDYIDETKVGGYAVIGPWLNSATAVTGFEGRLAVGRGDSQKYALLKVVAGETISLPLDDGSTWTFKDVQALTPWGSWTELVSNYKAQTRGP